MPLARRPANVIHDPLGQNFGVANFWLISTLMNQKSPVLHPATHSGAAGQPTETPMIEGVKLQKNSTDAKLDDKIESSMSQAKTVACPKQLSLRFEDSL
jgi:hypothetical protein